MFSLIIAASCGLGTGLALYFTDAFGYGWSVFFGVLGFGVVQMSIGFILQKKVKAAMKAVETVLLEGIQTVLLAEEYRPSQDHFHHRQRSFRRVGRTGIYVIAFRR